MTSDPTHICGAPVDVVILDVENPLEREMGPEVVTRRRVHNALGFASGTGGVENKQTIFTVHRLSGTIH